jgi:hypothetical protein
MFGKKPGTLFNKATLRMYKIIYSLFAFAAIINACHSTLQPWVSLGLLYNQSPPGVRFLNKIIFYSVGLLVLCPNPNLEDQGVSLSLDSTLLPYGHG